MKEAPIFITGLHKSGTTLLRSLLDGHPELQVIPFESHFFPLAGYWTANEYQYTRPKNFDPQRFIDFVHRSNTLSDKYGDNFAEGLLDEQVFQQHFSPDPSSSKPDLAREYFKALRLSLFGEQKGRMVEKSIENFEYYHDLKAFFPGAKFIHIIRNPYANLVSLRKFKSIGTGYPLLSRLLPAMQQQYYHLYRNAGCEDYKVVRYEDLVADTESCMKSISTFLELNFSDELLQPTLGGKAWGGNSMQGTQFKKVEARNDESWKAEISAFEIQLLNRAIPFVFDDYQYERLEEKGSIWKKMPGENWQRYFYNRLFTYYWRFYEAF
jgi:hypothetical protein